MSEEQARISKKPWYRLSAIEILVVIAIIAVLAALLLPPVQHGCGPAGRIRSSNNLKNLWLAYWNDLETYGDLVPASTVAQDGTPLHGWTTLLLPFLDERPLYERVDFDASWDDVVQGDTFATPLPVLQNPSLREREPTQIDYAANERLLKPAVVGGPRQSRDAGFERGDMTESLKMSCPDGASQTILMGEIVFDRPAWGRPMNLRDPALPLGRRDGFGGPMGKRPDPPESAQFAFADGRVRYIGKDIDPAVLRALATPDGDDDAGEDW